MSNVVISNRNIFNQKVMNIEKNKVVLPFNVSKEQTKKLSDLLLKVKITFLNEIDKLDISSLTFNDINVKNNDRQLAPGKFTLSKTYVVTMKQTFVNKVKNFYEKIKEVKIPERPIFSITKETNLQEALQEATTEIDLSTINASLNATPNVENVEEQNIQPQVQPTNIVAEPAAPVQPIEQPAVVETVMEAPATSNVVEQPTIAPVQEPVQNAELASNVVATPQVQPTNIVAEPATPVQPIEQPAVVETPNQVSVAPEVVEPQPKVKKLKGNVLAVPIVIVWLGLVFFGTLKLVTSILT